MRRTVLVIAFLLIVLQAGIAAGLTINCPLVYSADDSPEPLICNVTGKPGENITIRLSQVDGIGLKNKDYVFAETEDGVFAANWKYFSLPAKLILYPLSPLEDILYRFRGSFLSEPVWMLYNKHHRYTLVLTYVDGRVQTTSFEIMISGNPSAGIRETLQEFLFALVVMFLVVQFFVGFPIVLIQKLSGRRLKDILWTQWGLVIGIVDFVIVSSPLLATSFIFYPFGDPTRSKADIIAGSIISVGIAALIFYTAFPFDRMFKYRKKNWAPTKIREAKPVGCSGVAWIPFSALFIPFVQDSEWMMWALIILGYTTFLYWPHVRRWNAVSLIANTGWILFVFLHIQPDAAFSVALLVVVAAIYLASTKCALKFEQEKKRVIAEIEGRAAKIEEAKR